MKKTERSKGRKERLFESVRMCRYEQDCEREYKQSNSRRVCNAKETDVKKKVKAGRGSSVSRRQMDMNRRENK